MKNMVKFWGIIAFSAVIVFSMIGCGEDDSGDKNNQTGNNNKPGDGSINFSDAKWSNIDVYTVITGENSSVAPYSGSNKTFTKVTPLFLDVEGKESFSAVSNNPAEWNINITDNKLSIALGTPDKASPSTIIPDNLKTPSDLKVVLYQGFEDDNGNYISLSDPDIYAKTIFVHADKAGIISGSIEGYSINNINMNLKAGWNTAIFMRDNSTSTYTLTTGVPGSNYKWCFFAGEDGNDGSINFSDAKWSNIEVYNSDGSALYNGSDVTFTKAGLFTLGDPFSAFSSNPTEWNIKIENKKLFVSLGNPDRAEYPSLIPDSLNLDSLKVVVFAGFGDDSGNNVIMCGPDFNGATDFILFVYTDKAGIVSGSAEWGGSMMSYNLNLKTGWNTVFYKQDFSTKTGSMTTGVPGSNYKWCFSAGQGGNDGSIDFTDAKWRDIDVYTVITGENSSVAPYSGSNKTFTKVIPLFLDVEGKESFSAVSNNPAEWNINIANNKLSVALGTPDKASPSTIIPDNLKTPSDLKVVLYQGFDDGNDAISLSDPDIYATTIFVYADKAGIISGSANQTNFNLNLKAGWNTAIYMMDRLTSTVTLTTGVPGSNFKWYFFAGEGGNDGSIDFSDAKWRNIDVYNSDGSALYNGSDVTFTKVVDSTFSEVSSTPSAWNIKILNNKLSISLGNPDKAAHSDFIPDSVNSDGLKVVLYQGFEDDNGNYLGYGLSDNNSTTAVWFAYADNAGIVSGNADVDGVVINYNLNLKAGWNMVIFKQESGGTTTLTTGVPSSDLKWYFFEN